MSYRTLLPGHGYSFLYPRHNFEHVPTILEPRRLIVESVRDLQENPLNRETLTLNPYLKRGRWLAIGKDLSKNAERSFYVESMIGVTEIDLSQQEETVPIWIVGNLKFATEAEAEAAATALATIRKTEVAISVIHAQWADRQMVRQVAGQSRKGPRRFAQRKSA